MNDWDTGWDPYEQLIKITTALESLIQAHNQLAEAHMALLNKVAELDRQAHRSHLQRPSE